MNRVKFGHFDNFSYIFFGQNCLDPPKFTEFLCLWNRNHWSQYPLALVIIW